GQLRQGMAQIDLVLQAGAEQVVGVGGNTVRGNGALAHKLVRNCKKTAVIVAKTCSPGTREMRQRRYTSCVKWVLQGRLKNFRRHDYEKAKRLRERCHAHSGQRVS